ncbi:DUF4365 domain-containing protein [Kitasatospora sp. NPDC092039]|uniref:DUF4365 domain-containing protein n=1 Tax=Kitasatospora sp. NPDC092039 TaxID=3364086 RepID=UPI003800F876
MVDPDTWQQEQLSLAYVTAVATQARATVATWNVDKDGVDVTLKRNHQLVEVQLKCTHSPTITADGDYAFDLDVATYDKLRGERRHAAGFLALFIVPRDVNTWLVHDLEPKSLLVRCTGFYKQIQDMPATTNTSNKRIYLPPAQRLNAAGLDAMFAYADERLFGPSAQEAIA